MVQFLMFPYQLRMWFFCIHSLIEYGFKYFRFPHLRGLQILAKETGSGTLLMVSFIMMEALILLG